MARMCMSTYTKEAQTNSACSHGEISRVPFKEFWPCLPSILLRQIECMMVLWVSCVFKAGMWVCAASASSDWQTGESVGTSQQSARCRKHRKNEPGFAECEENSGQGRWIYKPTSPDVSSWGQGETTGVFSPQIHSADEDLQPRRGRIWYQRAKSQQMWPEDY